MDTSSRDWMNAGQRHVEGIWALPEWVEQKMNDFSDLVSIVSVWIISATSFFKIIENRTPINYIY